MRIDTSSMREAREREYARISEWHDHYAIWPVKIGDVIYFGGELIQRRLRLNCRQEAMSPFGTIGRDWPWWSPAISLNGECWEYRVKPKETA
ncbi:MAG TPA: hypothetical protein VKT73_12785 [Xanthobacteraceae bacterium]|nr:hypothetical protein [Xanthobacteraceae bacterium]